MIYHICECPEVSEVKQIGSVDVLIGYGYARYNSVPEQKSGNLLLLGNRMGRCLAGAHADLKDANHAMQNALAHHVAEVKIEDFYNIENLGMECTTRSGVCKCGKCLPGVKNYSLKETKEL